MSHTNAKQAAPAVNALANSAGFSRQPLTPEQQVQALKRVQAQAEQRVKLGMQLFKAAETRLSGQTDVLQQIKTLQTQLREQLNQDVAKTLQEYDQWIGQIDESFTSAIRKLEEKVDAVQQNLTTNEARMQKMLDRAEAMLDQTRSLIGQHTVPSMPLAPAPPATDTPQSSPQANPPTSPAPSSASGQPAEPVAPPPAAASVDPNGYGSPSAFQSELPPLNQSTAQDITGHSPGNIPASGNAETPIGPGEPADMPPSEPLGEDHKIYSKLLQRLIEDNPGAQAHGTSPAQPGPSPEAPPEGPHGNPGPSGNADAA